MGVSSVSVRVSVLTFFAVTVSGRGRRTGRSMRREGGLFAEGHHLAGGSAALCMCRTRSPEWAQTYGKTNPAIHLNEFIW